MGGGVESAQGGAQRGDVRDAGSASTEGIALTDDAFTLAVPNDFTREWIEGHFLGLIRAAVKDATGHERRIHLSVRDDGAPEPGADALEQPVRSRAPEPAASGSMSLKYTFDLFVIGSSNRFAHAAALAVAEAPAQAYNPLFIYGGTGLGKTHLLQAVGAVRRRARQRADRALRHQRDVHERLHQLAPRQADRGLQAALPHLRRPARRRRPVLRGQGADPGGVLPHLQLALRGRPPDRDLVRPAAEGDRDARGAPALALRVGPDHGHPAARPRDADRDPAQEGEDRPDPHPGPGGAHLRRRARDDEHPRARGRAHARRRLLLAHRPADDGRARRGRAQGRLPAGRSRSRSRSAGSRRPSPSASG